MLNDKKLPVIGLITILLILMVTGCQPSTYIPGTQTPRPGVTLSALPIQPTDTPEPGDAGLVSTIVAPTPTPLIYTIQKDDLGSYIALRYGITLAMLQMANPEVNLNFLQEGTTLVIPPPVNTPSPILYTPTPVLVGLGGVHCYPTVRQDLWCLVNVRNGQKEDVFYLTGEFLVGDEQKSYGVNVAGLADRIPPGKELPLIGFIQGPVGYPFQAEFKLNTSFSAEEPPVVSLGVENLKTDVDPAGVWIRVSGEVVNPDKALTYASVTAAGYEGDLPAGVRKLELTQGVPENGRSPFTMYVYSTGPRMDRVVILAEGK